MTASLTMGITDFALRVCEAPLSARQRIYRATDAVAKVLLALFLLPIVYTVAWFMIVVCSILASACISAEAVEIRKFREKLVSASPASLKEMVERIEPLLPRLERLLEADKKMRPLSPSYAWLLSSFGSDLENLIADYEDILEAIHIGLDPELRTRLLDSIKEETPQHVA